MEVRPDKRGDPDPLPPEKAHKQRAAVECGVDRLFCVYKHHGLWAKPTEEQDNSVTTYKIALCC